MKKRIDLSKKTAVVVVALSLFWGACASSIPHASGTVSGARMEVPREDLVIEKVRLSPNDNNVDVTEQVRSVLESEDTVRMRRGVFGVSSASQEKRTLYVSVIYALRGNRYCSFFFEGQELSRAALLADALRQYNDKPTHTLVDKWDGKKWRNFPLLELRTTRTLLFASSKGTREAPLNLVWFLKKDGSVLKQRSVRYFATGGTMMVGAKSPAWLDEFEFDPVLPDEISALVISDGKGVVCFELKPEDWRERAKPWTLSHW